MRNICGRTIGHAVSQIFIVKHDSYIALVHIVHTFHLRECTTFYNYE
jgi:hypothetical protein